MFIQLRNRVFQLIFIRTEFELLFELVVLLVNVLSLLLLSGELLLKSADVVLLGKELVLEGSNFFASVLMLWFSWLFVLCFWSMFGVFLFSRSRFVRFCNWLRWHSFGSSCSSLLLLGFHGLPNKSSALASSVLAGFSFLSLRGLLSFLALAGG